ncbi:lecithin retinol acyltransferase-like [Salarias fasciatus]|uniref:Lecithin retinol acyltransferase-like n=1 Tax=Salarias fasciatus TaxID=181472 RepID=A0A672HJR0_SALFA|nr:lecithin retinol acyltransferase-like [Salarias fasciatus]
MLDTLTFLLERLFLLAHIKLSSLLPPPPPPPPPPPAAAAPPAPPPAPPAFQRGDLLEVPRTLFTHFGIYLGEGRVAHLIPDALPLLCADRRRVQEMVTNTRLLLGVLSKRASVRVDSVEDFAYGAAVLRNAADATARRSALPAEEVARRAERRVGAVSYSLLWNNCEHFVTHCRYGDARSLQTEQFCDWLKRGVQDRRLAGVSLAWVLLWTWCSGLSWSSALLGVLLSFTLWMAS